MRKQPAVGFLDNKCHYQLDVITHDVHEILSTICQYADLSISSKMSPGECCGQGLTIGKEMKISWLNCSVSFLNEHKFEKN